VEEDCADSLLVERAGEEGVGDVGGWLPVEWELLERLWWREEPEETRTDCGKADWRETGQLSVMMLNDGGLWVELGSSATSFVST